MRFRFEIVLNRILSFDEFAAIKAASLTMNQKEKGKSIDFRDTQIAAIALVHEVPVATRNVTHFISSGVEIINPWERG